MKIVIIEDEYHTGWELKDVIEDLWPNFQVISLIDSVHFGLQWFREHDAPDLIFSDIQLGDGLCFDIFKKIKIDCPVIFCTAYDEYAIAAFENNGIDYLLKPISEKSLKRSIAKIDLFKRISEKRNDQDIMARIINIIESKNKIFKSTFLVNYRDRIVPLTVDQIAFFHYKNRNVQICSHQNEVYTASATLDYFESVLDPGLFNRANRQFIISRSVIKELKHRDERKLQVKLNLPNPEAIIISKTKAQSFLRWLENDPLQE